MVDTVIFKLNIHDMEAQQKSLKILAMLSGQVFYILAQCC
jgi:hypothetical protein